MNLKQRCPTLSNLVQPCCHSPQVATGDLNVATDMCFKIDLYWWKHCISLEWWQKLRQLAICCHSCGECGDRENMVEHLWFKGEIYVGFTHKRIIYDKKLLFWF
jgi:hypothetical protein